MQKIDLFRGYFSIGIYEPKVSENIGTLWRHAYLYNASFIFTIGAKYKKQKTDTMKSLSHIPLYEYEKFDDFFNSMPKESCLVGVELTDEAEFLHEFNHPLKSNYLLGSEGDGLPQSIIEQCDYRVKLYSPKSQSMNVAVTGTMVMYDRTIKNILKWKSNE